MSALQLSVGGSSGSLYASSYVTPDLDTSAQHSYLADQSFSATLVDFTGPAAVSYSIGGNTLPDTTVVTFAYPSPASIRGIVKTRIIFPSTENSVSTVVVVYSVSDNVGRSQCNPAGAAVSIAVGSSSGLCSLFTSPAAPYGSCSLTIDSSLFKNIRTTLPVSITLTVGSALVQTVSLGSVTLSPKPSQNAPSVVGLYFQVPIYVAVPGDTVSVDMWAQTASTSNSLESWGASLVFDMMQLNYVGIAHPLYTTVLTSSAVPNSLNITGSGGSGIIAGWFLVCTVSFAVLPAAASNSGFVQISMPAVSTNAMVTSI